LTRPLVEVNQTKAQARHLRALTLRGAEAVLAGTGGPASVQAHLIQRYRAIPAGAHLLALGAPPGEPDRSQPATKALAWARGR